jgi:hypothetical protein
MRFDTDRRDALLGLGSGLILSGMVASTAANAAPEPTLEPAAAKGLHDLSHALAGMPRRRDFQSVPMILDNPDYWDQAPLAAVLAYKGGARQAWDNTDIAGPWLNGMRNSLNSQIWGFKEANFLCVSATHGAAHLALFDQSMWDKYQLAKLAGGNIARNSFIDTPAASAEDPAHFQSAGGPFSSKNNSIVALQRRGVVFMACHNAIWEVAERLAASEQNSEHRSVDAIATDLTNHLIPDVVLTPGIVATLVKLQQAGFAYSR